MAFTPVKQERVYETVAAQLRNAILSGTYEPGQRLPNERELVDTFQVSRTAIRQATMLLEQQGLVDVRVGASGGVFIRNRSLSPLLESFEMLFSLNGLSPAEFFAAKRVIEPSINRRAAELIDDEGLKDLRLNLARTSEVLDDGGDPLDQLVEFHEILGRATGNPILELVIIAFDSIAKRTPAFRAATPHDWREALREHELMLEAIENRDLDELDRLTEIHLAALGDVYSGEPRKPAPSE